MSDCGEFEFVKQNIDPYTLKYQPMENGSPITFLMFFNLLQ